jgi:chemotaxis protein CheZ
MSNKRRVFSAERALLARQGDEPLAEAATAAAAQAPAAPAVTAEEFARLQHGIDQINRKIDTFINLDHDEINRMRVEVAEIAHRIEGTKREIAQLRHPLASDDRLLAASEELGAIVDATESATSDIFTEVEQVEEIARELQSIVTDDYQMQRINQIADLCTRIYEACSFQDLTGQRITKVVRTLSFIEERVNSMMAIWGHKALEEMPLPEEQHRVDDGIVLHGPSGAEGSGTASQDDIDALFD